MKRKEFLRNAMAASVVTMISPLTSSCQSANSALPDKVATAENNSVAAKVIRNTEGKKVNVIGDQMTFKLTGKDTNGQFTLIEEFNDPGVGIPLHVHEHEDEVFKVLEGEMELVVDGKTTILKAGDIGYGPRGIPHAWRIVGEQKAKVILTVFPSGIEVMFEELGQLPAGPPDLAKVGEICGRYGIRFV